MSGRGAVRIRLAADSDIAELMRIRIAVRENRLADPASIGPEAYREMMNERGHGWVAELDGRIVGFAIADRSRANIWALFVDPPCEGLGAGRLLHDTMMDWLFASGVETAWLSTDPSTRAERFYIAAGWGRAGAHHGEHRYEMTRERWTGRRVKSAP